MSDRTPHSVTRRDFIKTTTTTATGAVAAANLFGGDMGAAARSAPTVNPRVIGANDRIRLGLIGVKGMGGGHLRNLVGDEMKNDNVEVAAICDVWETIRRKAQATAQLHDSAVYTDYRRLLDNKEIDAVVVAVPDHWHGQMGIDALNAGKHLYIEKPMTRYLDEAFKIYDAAKRTKLLVQVGSHHCSDPRYKRASELVAAGTVGQLLWAQASYCRNNPKGEWNYALDPDANANTVDWQAWLGPAPKRAWSAERYFRWRKYWDYGTGVIGDLWPHRLLPLMLALNLNEFPRSVSCMGGDLCEADRRLGANGKPYGELREVADTSIMMVDFPSGVMIVVASSTVNERGFDDVIRGTKGNLTIGGGRLQVTPERPYADEIDARDETPPDPRESHVKHMRNFLESLRANVPPICNEELGIRVQAIVAMAEVAYRKRTLVRFDERTREICV
jgi:predicted dehydrogenase